MKVDAKKMRGFFASQHVTFFVDERESINQFQAKNGDQNV